MKLVTRQIPENSSRSKQQTSYHLSEYGIPSNILNLIKDMYKEFRCKVLQEGKLNENFITNTGERQDCILSPVIFLLVLDRIIRKTGWKEKRNSLEHERQT
jgi:hypothetical protein